MIRYNSIYVQDNSSMEKDPTPEAKKVLAFLNAEIGKLILQAQLRVLEADSDIQISFGEWDTDDLEFDDEA